MDFSKIIKKWRLITIVLLAFLLLLISWLIGKNLLNQSTPFISTSYSILVNFASTLVGFIVAALILEGERHQEDVEVLKTTILEPLGKKAQESSENSKNLIIKMDELISKIEPPTVLDDINWKKLIAKADEINFLVQGWDGWMNTHSRELEEFFRRGGKFNLFVVNEEGESAAPVRELMKVRLNKTLQHVIVEITNTISNIQYAFEAADDPSSQKDLKIFRLNDINWYFAAQFKSKSSDIRDALVLSLYSHHPYRIRETPAIMVYRDSAPPVFKWFDSELEKLKKNSAQ